jgi:hypothetical protein
MEENSDGRPGEACAARSGYSARSAYSESPLGFTCVRRNGLHPTVLPGAWLGPHSLSNENGIPRAGGRHK